ncbi:MAG TPA: 6-hydroxycyclohex-1-ene-1-carbonyl-CoA dehydrogenase [Vicinamibacteria bacterium]|nr:6-hydroxycyclohex-1-ene-1-carbonyl-CoA dehydrogenase [Vicinamibacteria bacterium]
MRVVSWMVHRPGEPMVRTEREETVETGEVLVRVAGCGVCHTDLGFFYDGVPTKHGFPLCLGHEVSGRVVQAGAGAESWVGRDVIVPAVIPCGSCDACRAGRGSVCPSQIFPGSDVHGGFGSHVKVPARGLCPVPDLTDARLNPSGADLASLSVVADAVSTPYQAIARSGLGASDLAVFVGVGGVGGFGVQIAAALGAHVVAIDVDPARLETLSRFGAELTLRADVLEAKALKAAVRELAKAHAVPTWRQKIFETSGTPAGQAAAFSLLGHGGYLGVVGFTPEKVELKLSNLMAFDATAQGNWGCLPELYPKALDMVLSGKVRIAPFIERRALDSINETFEALRARKLAARPVLVPEG